MNKSQHIKHLLSQGFNKEEIMLITGSSEQHIKQIIPSTKRNLREQAIRLREEGYTLKRIAATLEVSIGSVQNFLRLPKRLIKRYNPHDNTTLYFYSISHVMQYHPELYRKSIYKLINFNEEYWGYRFSFEHNPASVDPLFIASYKI